MPRVPPNSLTEQGTADDRRQLGGRNRSQNMLVTVTNHAGKA